MTLKVVIPPTFRKKIGKAMHDYSMFADGDRVLVAVSGGIDSLSLVCMLRFWLRIAPIHFSIDAIHIDHGFWLSAGQPVQPSISIGEQLKKWGLELKVEPEYELADQERSCFLCARNRRNQLFELARQNNYNKICFGHHKDDLLETFMLNVLYSGNISTMLPRQNLFNGSLSLVRPFAYLEKSEVQHIGELFGMVGLKNYCPLAEDVKRKRVRVFLEKLYAEEPGAKQSMFAALSNVRHDYLLPVSHDR